MSHSSAITTLFLDIGNVLLTDSWGPSMRQRAMERFGFEVTEVAERSRLAFEVYEQGKISLDEFLNWVVFYKDRPFSREALKAFMLAQSQPHLEMIALVRALKTRHGLKVVVVTDDGREFIVHRIQQFGLAAFVDCFIVSCFVRCRKPDPDIYRMALDVAQVAPAHVVYIDDQSLFVEAAQSLSIRGIQHTGYESTRAALEGLGLALAP
jgi:putative hydrolase of the HAD superfamily